MCIPQMISNMLDNSPIIANICKYLQFYGVIDMEYFVKNLECCETLAFVFNHTWAVNNSTKAKKRSNHDKSFLLYVNKSIYVKTDL